MFPTPKITAANENKKQCSILVFFSFKRNSKIIISNVSIRYKLLITRKKYAENVKNMMPHQIILCMWNIMKIYSRKVPLNNLFPLSLSSFSYIRRHMSIQMLSPTKRIYSTPHLGPIIVLTAVIHATDENVSFIAYGIYENIRRDCNNLLLLLLVLAYVSWYHENHGTHTKNSLKMEWWTCETAL